MKNELQIFNFNTAEVKIIIENNEPLFEVYSVGMALGQVKKNTLGKEYPNKDRIDNNIESAGINPCVRDAHKYINEEQLYDLMFEMKTDKVKPFRKWVTNEVLPSIRKHGAYATSITLEKMIADPQWAIGLFQQLKKEQDARRIAEEEKEILEIALNQSMSHRTVMQYNQEHNKRWDMETCKRIGKELSAYCRSHGIKIQKCKTNDDRFKEVNSYYLTAWDDFMNKK